MQNPTIEQELPVGDESDHCTSDNQQLAPIDAFLESISKPLPQPLLTQRPRQNLIKNGASPPIKRQSSRLAQKAIANSGKGTIEIAQDLLIKKLGDLAGTDNTGANKPPLPDKFDLYAQHFARPIEKTMMDAIQDLIEHGALIQKKSGNQGEAAVAPGLVA